MNTRKGFIEIIIIIVLAAILLAVIGFNPLKLWEDFLVPILESAWEILGSVIKFLIEVGLWIVEKLGPQR